MSTLTTLKEHKHSIVFSLFINSHEIPIGYPPDFHGIPMGFPRDSRWNYMGFPSYFSKKEVGIFDTRLKRDSRWISVGIFWEASGFTRTLQKIPIRFPTDTHQ